MARKFCRDRGIVEKPKGSGKWWVRHYENGREYWHRVENRTQGKALYQRLKSELREGKYFTKAKVFPFCVIAKDYEAVVEANRRGRVGDDRARIQRWVDEFGDQDAKDIAPDQVQRVLLQLQREGKKPATLQRYLNVFKAIMNRPDGLEQVMASIRKKVKVPKYDNELVRYLTSEQESRLLTTLPKEFNLVMVMALNTGLRQGELLRLQWADVNWQTGMVTILKTKSGKPRRVPLNTTVQNTLLVLKGKGTSSPSAKIFPHDARYLRRTFTKAVQAAGLGAFRFHDLRHTFASRLAMQGCNDRTLMELGGWESPRMLKRYAHIGPAHLWQAVEGLTAPTTGCKTGCDEKVVENKKLGYALETIVFEGEKIGAGKGI